MNKFPQYYFYEVRHSFDDGVDYFAVRRNDYEGKGEFVYAIQTDSYRGPTATVDGETYRSWLKRGNPLNETAIRTLAPHLLERLAIVAY